jgi:hypothetical protein
VTNNCLMHELYAPMIHFSNSFYKNQRENNEVFKNYNWCITIELCQIYFKTLILSNYLITKTYLYMNFIIIITLNIFLVLLNISNLIFSPFKNFFRNLVSLNFRFSILVHVFLQNFTWHVD